MLTPRYFFAGDFRRFYEYFLSRPHRKRNFHKGEYLWEPGSPYGNLYYIVSGTAVHGAEHESGHRKIISFHGPGTVFPGYHQADYKIELSLSMAALSELETLEFSREQFRAMFESNKELSGQVVNWYSMYVNRLLFETVHVHGIQYFSCEDLQSALPSDCRTACRGGAGSGDDAGRAGGASGTEPRAVHARTFRASKQKDCLHQPRQNPGHRSGRAG